MVQARKRVYPLDTDRISQELKGICVPQLDDVARRLCVSPRSLQRYLADQNMSFSELLDHVRSTRAKELLRNTDLSIAEIAKQMGQGDVSNFGRTFRRWTGDSPAHWRKAARKKR